MCLTPTCSHFMTAADTVNNEDGTNDPSLTRVWAQVPFEGSVAWKGALAVATDVAVHACMGLHVLLQGLLGLEALCTQQTEHRHVSPWRTRKTQTHSYFSTIHRQGLKWGNWVTSTLCESSEGKASFKEQVPLPKLTPLKAQRHFQLWVFIRSILNHESHCFL